MIVYLQMTQVSKRTSTIGYKCISSPVAKPYQQSVTLLFDCAIGFYILYEEITLYIFVFCLLLKLQTQKLPVNEFSYITTGPDLFKLH